MTKFKQYIKESFDYEGTYNFIMDNCQPFLYESDIHGEHGTFLYRGAKSEKDIFTIKIPRKDRKPKDMPIAISQAMDVIFQRNIGWKPRSEGVFTSTSINSATSYSTNVYRVFPIGQYKYVYIKNMMDTYSLRFEIETKLSVLLDETLQYTNRIFNSLRKIPLKDLDPKIRNYLLIATKEVLKKKTIKTSSLSTLEGRATEVTLKCKKYCMLKSHYWELMLKFKEQGFK